MHFDLGEIGAKDILGENGVLQQAVDSMPSMPTTSVPASILPTMRFSSREPSEDPRSSTRGPMPSNLDPHQHLDEPRTSSTLDSLSSAGDDSHEDRDARLPSSNVSRKGAAIDGGVGSSRPSVHQRKAAYLVSATASGGRAEVYVAKAYDLKRIQTESFRYSWKTAQRLHQARVQGWSAGALVQQLRGQQDWECLKRDVLSKLLIWYV